ncbi:MAG TPA: hypothetical protein VIL36_03040 [Acidimicrobiales bacterium]
MTTWTVAISVSIAAVLGFTLDAGRVLRARSEAYGTAAAAARFGASRLDERVYLTEDRAVLDPDAARQAIDDFLETEGYTALPGFSRTITVDELTVTVRIQHHVEALSILDVGTLNIDVTATAEAIQVDPAALP